MARRALLLATVLLGLFAAVSNAVSNPNTVGGMVAADCKDPAILNAASQFVALLNLDRTMCEMNTGANPVNVTGVLVYRDCLRVATQATATINYDLKLNVAEYRANEGSPRLVEVGGVVAYNPIIDLANKQQQETLGQAWTITSCLFRGKPKVTQVTSTLSRSTKPKK